MWVFNFGAVPVGQTTDVPTGISRFCGMRSTRPGMSGLTNNWKRDANPVLNPFGNAIVVAVGAAGPLETPLIGPPVGF